MSLLEFLLSIFLVYAILKKIAERRDENSNGRINVPHSFVKQEVIVFKIEKINDIYYLWNKDSEDFLAQGPTVEEALNIMVERFPDKIFRSENVITQA